MTTDSDKLNDAFAVDGRLRFAPGPGGLTVAQIRNDHAAADVALLGGHVLSYRPAGGEDLLWVSERSAFEPGRPIRGGIPVCWPWFAAHPTDESLPLHGFARTLPWQVVETGQTDDGGATLALRLTDSPETQLMWPHAFELTLTVIVGPKLDLALTTRSTGREQCTVTQALHTYFHVSNVADVEVHGLEQTDYLDKVEDFKRKTQVGPVRIHDHTDRIYVDTEAQCVISDPGFDHRVFIAKRGSRTTVVWNPWIEKSKELQDFGDAEYQRMLCVETANAAEDVVTLAPGDAHTLRATIHAEPRG